MIAAIEESDVSIHARVLTRARRLALAAKGHHPPVSIHARVLTRARLALLGFAFGFLRCFNPRPGFNPSALLGFAFGFLRCFNPRPGFNPSETTCGYLAKYASKGFNPRPGFNPSETPLAQRATATRFNPRPGFNPSETPLAQRVAAQRSCSAFPRTGFSVQADPDSQARGSRATRQAGR
uniref:Uncharacterized protein n=1 Tax=mine drainage metagenome TaxID=410659 RepID=E6PND9_9ZZZZ